MLKNYLKIAIRNLVRQRMYSGLNILGLAVGLGSALLIFLFVQHELSYDKFFQKGDQNFRVIARQPNNVFMGNDRFVVTPASLGPELVQIFPEVELATIVGRAPVLIVNDEASFYEQGIWADSNFFDIFSYPFLSGASQSALRNPNGLVLTASMARKIFGDKDPLGEEVAIDHWDEQYSMVVEGVMVDPPENSHLQYDFILPMQANRRYSQDLPRRTSSSYSTYIQLQDADDVAALQAKMDAFEVDFFGAEHAENFDLIIQPVSDIHLFANANFEMGTPGDIKRVFLFGTIGILILLLACVNYMNLAVARSMKRMQEVGVRQAIGARRFQIAGQFIFESVLIAAIALVFGLCLTWISLPVFSGLVDRTLTLEWHHPLLLPGLVTLVLVVGLVSGSYPAFFMSRVKPARVLKGSGVKGRGRIGLQRTLIVLQYTVSIALIAGSLVVYQQLQYIQNKEVGYARERLVALQLQGSEVDGKLEAIQEEMLRVPGVEMVSVLSSLPTNIGSSQRIDSWEGSSEGERMQLYQANVGYEFFEMFDISLATGRPFSRDLASDTLSSVIINETAAHAFGWEIDEAIGKRLQEQYEVIGVMKDFHLHSLHIPIAPMMVRMDSDWYSYIVARIQSEEASATVAGLERVLAGFTPYPVSAEFLDDVHQKMYEADVKLGSTIGYFAFIAVLIATLGLFGLAAYATQRRTKEVGVRKVLGASVPSLLTLLSREFVLLVLVSIVFAVPAAIYFARQWLENFAYRIELGAGVFILTTLLAIAIALLAVSYQAFRAATTNPVKALRYE